MLINGDLIRVPQGTVIMAIGKEPLPVRVVTDQSMAIVIENKTPCEDLVKILMGDEIVFVDKRVVRLVGG
jgi:hypothetical protein